MNSVSGSAVTAGSVAVPDGTSSYPGGKSGAGIYQRLINLIPPHRILITAFAGRCGVVRRIRSAEHTIIIDADADVCQWWADWSRTRAGRSLEIHHCDSIEWMRFHFGLTEYCDAGSSVVRSRVTGRSRSAPRLVMATDSSPGSDASSCDTRATHESRAEAFLFCDPPYVLSQRAHGKQYACELTDGDHKRLLRILTAIPATVAAVMLCGYASPLYAAVDRAWRTIDHRVPTRGGLQDERIWMNYALASTLHDYSYLGGSRRERERIRRRQRNWTSQLAAMSDLERAAMLAALQASGSVGSPVGSLPRIPPRSPAVETQKNPAKR